MPLIVPPPFNTERLQLRLVEERDLPDLMSVNGDDVATRYLPYATWKNLDDAQAWLVRMQGFQATGNSLQFVIVQLASNKAIGTCCLINHDATSARIEIGYVLCRRYWRRGYALEAIRALITHAIEDQGVRRIEAQIDPRNEASNGLIVQLGFQLEGLLRQRYVSKGEIQDTNLYGLLADEWQ